MGCLLETKFKPADKETSPSGGPWGKQVSRAIPVAASSVCRYLPQVAIWPLLTRHPWKVPKGLWFHRGLSKDRLSVQKKSFRSDFGCLSVFVTVSISIHWIPGCSPGNLSAHSSLEMTGVGEHQGQLTADHVYCYQNRYQLLFSFLRRVLGICFLESC